MELILSIMTVFQFLSRLPYRLFLQLQRYFLI
jgi:hypothetical protein